MNVFGGDALANKCNLLICFRNQWSVRPLSQWIGGLIKMYSSCIFLEEKIAAFSAFLPPRCGPYAKIGAFYRVEAGATIPRPAFFRCSPRVQPFQVQRNCASAVVEMRIFGVFTTSIL